MTKMMKKNLLWNNSEMENTKNVPKIAPTGTLHVLET